MSTPTGSANVRGTEPRVASWVAMPVGAVLGLLLGPLGDLGRPAVAAIDGRSGSGKSTVARRLAAAHGAATIVHTDDVAWYESFLGWDDILATHVLAPVRDGRLPVRYRPPAWDARGRPGAIEVPDGVRLLLVEGVGASRTSLGPLLDAAIWVQADRAIASERGITRDGGDERAVAFWDEWQAVEVPFLEGDRPWRRATLVVSGTPLVPHDAASDLVIAKGPLGDWPGP